MQRDPDRQKNGRNDSCLQEHIFSDKPRIFCFNDVNGSLFPKDKHADLNPRRGNRRNK